MRTLIKTLLMVAGMLLLAGCGGGGGGGGGGSSGGGSSGGIPNTLIPTAGLGDKDPYFMPDGGYEDGDSSRDIRNATDAVYQNGVTAFGKRIQGSSTSASLDVPTPPRDVRTVWREGWTGNGINILLVDSFGTAGILGNNSSTHGYSVLMSAAEVAVNANYYAFDAGLENTGLSYRQGGINGGLRNINNATVSANTKIDVLNMSFGSEPIPFDITEAELEEIAIEVATDPLLNDVLGGDHLTGAADAVLVKAAGNDDVDSLRLLENTALVVADVTKARVLIIGALDKYAQQGGARRAVYSNFAGALPDLQQRFLVEYGGSPYSDVAGLCDATSSPGSCDSAHFIGDTDLAGTSFAAPRVAGHAALVRHKFPGLSAPQTTKILLDTATYEGLACHTTSAGCPITTYGQGRVHLGDALSPSGKLE